MGLSSPQRVRDLGSAKSGTEHWWRQRLTSVALIPLALFLIVLAVSLIGADYPTAARRLGHPAVTVGLVLALPVLAWHMQLGMQVIIEDYVHRRGWKVAALLANTLVSAAVALVGLFAALTLSFGA